MGVVGVVLQLALFVVVGPGVSLDDVHRLIVAEAFLSVGAFEVAQVLLVHCVLALESDGLLVAVVDARLLLALDYEVCIERAR